MLQDISTGAVATRICNLWNQQKNGERKNWSFFLNHHNIEKIQTPESPRGKQEKQIREQHKQNKRTAENTTGVPRTIGAKISKS